MWILFSAIGLWFFIRCVRQTGWTDRVSSGAHGVMALSMAWGMDLPAWWQLAVFGPVTLWFAGLATVPYRSRRFAVHHAFMAAAMVVMACLMTMPGHGLPIVPALLGAYFLIATPVLVRADSAGHAVMSLGAGVMLLEMV